MNPTRHPARKMNLKYWLLAALVAATPALHAADAPATPVLLIEPNKVTAEISPMFYGLMTEEINYSYDGGLYAELIANRTFQDNSQNPARWSLVQDAGAAGAITLDHAETLNSNLNTSLNLTATTTGPTQRVGAANEGFWGIPVKPNTTYRASFYAKAGVNFTGPVIVAIASTTNPVTYAMAEVPKITDTWQKYEVTLKTGDVKPTKDANFLLMINSPGNVWFSLVSLFPPTYNNRPNGNRIDIMKLLADYKPAFLRFPGGNYLEGNTIATRFDWKKTIGDISQRPGHLDDAWGYFSADGMGLLEFMEWCEDLKMEPVVGLYAGYSLRGQRVAPGPDLEPYVQDALDEIEYISGDVSTKWGAVRAKDGHPAPFKLQYVEIGNEDNFDRAGGGTYAGRFSQFYDALRAKYPKLKIISSTGVQGREPDIKDDHYYPAPARMRTEAHHYDAPKYTRTGPKIFVGEYATRTGNNGPQTSNLEFALADAAFLTGLERNADVVVMASYAPLFINMNIQANPTSARIWRTDLIGYDALTSFGSVSYYIQKMFSNNLGNQAVAATLDGLTQNPDSFFYSVTKNSKDDTIYVKGVNTGSEPLTVRIDLKEAFWVSSDGQATVLKSDNPADLNTVDEPTKVVPVTSKLTGLSPSFSHTFPPYSATVLQFRAKAIVRIQTGAGM